jgi:hypothetical protein
MQCKSMNVKRRGLLAGACFAALLVAGVAGSAYAADYMPMTRRASRQSGTRKLSDDPWRLQGCSNLRGPLR